MGGTGGRVVVQTDKVQKSKASTRDEADETRMDGLYDMVGGRVQKNRDKQTRSELEVQG